MNKYCKQILNALKIYMLCIILLLCSIDVYAIEPSGNSTDIFELKGHSVALGNSFALKYYLDLSSEVKNDSSSYVQFTVGGKSQKAYPAMTASGQAVYTCNVSAKQLGDTVKAELYYGGKAYSIGDYSVARYMNTLINNKDYAASSDVAKAILNYGGYAQKYFAYNTGSLANQDLYSAGQNPVELLSDSSLMSMINTQTVGSASNVDFSYIGASLTCGSDMSLRLYFDNKSSLTKEQINNKYNCYISGNKYPVEIGANGSIFYITLKNLPATSWDSTFSFIVQNKTSSDKMTIEYGPMSYVKSAMSSKDSDLKNLCKAIYLYNKAANNYKVADNYVVSDTYPDNDQEELDPLFAVPYVSTYYFNPKPLTTDNIEIPLYVTDYSQSEYLKNNYGKTLDLIYEVDGVSDTITDVALGDYTLTLGSLSEGIHTFTVQVRDNTNGLTSAKLYNELWVVSSYEISTDKIYKITEQDLANYGIKNNNSTDATDMINTRDGLTKLFADKQAEGYRKVILPDGNGVYRINGEEARNNCITIPSYLTVDMNGSTFKLDTIANETSGCIVLMNNAIDAHLENGILEGDRYERQKLGLEVNGQGEGINTVLIRAGKYCSLNNLTIKNTTGHTIYSEVGMDVFTQRQFTGFTNVAIIDGREVESDKYCTSKAIDLTSYIDWDSSEDYFYIGFPGGYRGIRTNSAYVYVSFYDESNKFMETSVACQYRKIGIPKNAKYVRVTAYEGDVTDTGLNQLTIYSRRLVEYSSITNISFENTRTCAIAITGCNNLLIEKNKYTGCANSITPVPVDFEDGWEECQDVYYRNNNVISKAELTTGTIVDNAGFNHVYENCTNHQMLINGRVTGLVVRNMNDDRDMFQLDVGSKITNSYGRICDNNCGAICFMKKDKDGSPILDLATLGENEVAKLVDIKVKNCIIKNGLDYNSNHCFGYIEKVTYDGCTFTSFAGHNANFVNCTIQPASYMNDKLHFYNCTFKALDGSEYIQLNLSTPYDADRLFENCKFEGKVYLGTKEVGPNNFHSAIFTNCSFDDVEIKAIVESTESRILFENCTMNSTAEDFLYVWPYGGTIDYINVQFKNCEITHTGANLVSFFSLPSKNSQVMFDGCTINKNSGYLLKWALNYTRAANEDKISVDVTFKNTSVDSNLGIDNAVASKYARVYFN